MKNKYGVVMKIEGTKITKSIFIFGVKNERWICKDKEEAIKNYKTQLEEKTKTADLSILELKQNKENEWQIAELPLIEIINELYQG